MIKRFCSSFFILSGLTITACSTDTPTNTDVPTNPIDITGECINGSDTIIEVSRSETAPFSMIETSSIIEVLVTQEANDNIRIEANENIVSFIESTFSDDTLALSLSEDECFTDIQVKVYVGVDQLSALSASGASSITGLNQFASDQLSNTVLGASTIDIDVTASQITSSISGASILTLSGTASDHDIVVTGASTVDAFGLVTDNVDVRASGSSTANVFVSNELIADAEGVSAILYQGQPVTVQETVTGLATIAAQPDSESL